MPFFSIIIPTYNRKNSLEKAINSVLSQTFTDFEILVMDDGSQDGTDSYIYSIADSRVFYEWKENTGGPANPRNRGIQKSKGEWICFLDADDSWASNKLEYCFDAINEDIDFIFHDLYLMQSEGDSTFSDKLKGRKLTVPVLKDLLIYGNAISTSSVVIRRSIVNKVSGFDESPNVLAAEDFKFWLEIATQTNKFKYLNLVLGVYLDIGQGISNKNMSLVYFNAIEHFLNYLDLQNKKKALSIAKYINAKYLIKTDQYWKSKSDLFFCLKYAKIEIQIKAFYLLVFMFYIRIKNNLLNDF